MPELPEVEIVKRGLEPVMLGACIQALRLNRLDLRVPIPPDLPKTLAGQRIETILRRGKYILAFTGGGAGFALHLGMSGRIRIYAPDEDYIPQKHDHVVFEMQAGQRIVFNDARRFGFLDAALANTWQATPPFNRMGPEPLDAGFTGETLALAFMNRKSPVKTALLDQRVVAGIGNIYACEALYRSGIAPDRAAGSLDGGESVRLAIALQDVLKDAIAAGGSTLRDHRMTDGSLGYFQHRFAVYDRENNACPDCVCERAGNAAKDGLQTQNRPGVGIRRIVQGGRSTFYCAVRQK
ncbi:MAG: bifunctional DNA-formamidopyrimidine glycosylase/DNA-(apurinic or apyrimidinic site) lyase [Alphaproteobacteria bacterium]|nr:bifunctional DNA-formamidopyrimidine glycosylase/DNA-(apurinic or apyrimidinic site) lyase [Alphaproteobacteria bacterium]